MVHTQGGSVLYVYTKFDVNKIVQKLLGGPEISTLGHVTQAMPILASFCFPYAGRCVVRLCTKFEADWSILSKVIHGVPKL